MCQRLTKFTALTILWASALLIASCGPKTDAPGSQQANSTANENGAAPTVTSAPRASATADPFVGRLKVGEAEIDLTELKDLARQFGRNFDAFGPETLAWNLLHEGLGPSALLHQRFAEESATAKLEAEAVAARILSKSDFYDEYQARGGSPEAQNLKPPTPYGVGARVAAQMAEMEAGEWLGPAQTIQGWEIVLLEERADSLRMVAGLAVRSIVFEVGADLHRKEAREAWATLPIQAPTAFLRILPAAFRRGRVTTD